MRYTEKKLEPFSIRLKESIGNNLESYCRKHKVTKTEIIELALTDWMRGINEKETN